MNTHFENKFKKIHKSLFFNLSSSSEDKVLHVFNESKKNKEMVTFWANVKIFFKDNDISSLKNQKSLYPVAFDHSNTSLMKSIQHCEIKDRTGTVYWIDCLNILSRNNIETSDTEIPLGSVVSGIIEDSKKEIEKWFEKERQISLMKLQDALLNFKKEYQTKSSQFIKNENLIQLNRSLFSSFQFTGVSKLKEEGFEDLPCLSKLYLALSQFSSNLDDFSSKEIAFFNELENYLKKLEKRLKYA